MKSKTKSLPSGDHPCRVGLCEDLSLNLGSELSTNYRESIRCSSATQIHVYKANNKSKVISTTDLLQMTPALRSLTAYPRESG